MKSRFFVLILWASLAGCASGVDDGVFVQIQPVETKVEARFVEFNDTELNSTSESRLLRSLLRNATAGTPSVARLEVEESQRLMRLLDERWVTVHGGPRSPEGQALPSPRVVRYENSTWQVVFVTSD